MKRVLFITEYLNPPYDEGIKKTAYNLFLELDKNYELLVICRFGFVKDNVIVVDTNPLFISNRVKQIIRDFKPRTLIYLPFQASTFASYLRLKLLSLYSKAAINIFIALQPKPLKKWQQFVVKFIKPQKALTPSPTLKRLWDRINVESKLIPLLTNLSVFKPINHPGLKHRLRIKYDLPSDATIISHMGHLNDGRNLKSLIPLQKSGFQIVIVSSSSTPMDAMGQESLKDELLESGIIVLDGYIEHIEEIYQLSDLYIFPVIKENSSIGLPLSILEARACAVPVISTEYGSTKLYLEDDFGGIIYSDPDNFIESIKEFEFGSHDYENTKVTELNSIFYNIIHKQIQG